MKKVLMVLLPFVFSLCLLTGCFSPEDLLEKAKLQQDETETTTDFQGCILATIICPFLYNCKLHFNITFFEYNFH